MHRPGKPLLEGGDHVLLVLEAVDTDVQAMTPVTFCLGLSTLGLKVLWQRIGKRAATPRIYRRRQTTCRIQKKKFIQKKNEGQLKGETSEHLPRFDFLPLQTTPASGETCDKTLISGKGFISALGSYHFQFGAWQSVELLGPSILIPKSLGFRAMRPRSREPAA